MTDQDRISAVETALRAACAEAREQGLVLVKDVSIVRIGGVAVGCCVWGARNLTAPGDAEELPVTGDEYDAIEHGWDGERVAAERYGLPMPWFEMGARLAAEFQPVAARELEAG
jgi:hypothetical protein